MSKKIFFRSVLSIFLIFCISLTNVNSALADDSTPPPATEEPTQEPTEELTQPGIEAAEPAATETPTVDESPSNVDQVLAEEETSTSTLFSQVPEETSIVVLDESGNPIPLVSQQGLDVILEDDPMWCPGTTPPGGANCISFTGTDGITKLLADMQLHTDLYDENGTIYFTSDPGNGSFTLTNASDSLSTDYTLLSGFNLILQGGWNGSTVDPQYDTTTNFGSNSITIGTAGNPWVGNITLSNFTFSGVSTTNAVTVYTTNGDITLNNVDVTQQAGGNYTANLVSSSGDITVQNGSTFDGNTGNTNQGFNASTTTGTINITGDTVNPITFTDASGGAGANYNGATLSAPTVTLNYVTATGNDLNGIYITNATTVTLNNVNGGSISSGNGTNPPGNNNSVGSGVYIQGPAGGTNVSVSGGYFANNERYGIEIINGTITFGTAPTYGSGGSANEYGDLSVNTVNTAPALNLPANIITEATSADGATVTFTVSATDVQDNPDPTPTCNLPSGSVFAIATTTVNCSVTDSNNVTTTGSFTVTVRDTTGPALTLPANITQEATGPTGGDVTYTASATDLVDGARLITCVPASGSTFAIATTTVNCSSTDSRNNTNTGSFTITILDTTQPVIAAQLNITAEATGAAGAIVTYTNPTTTDLVDGAGFATCSPASGSTFALGNTTVTCNASDAHGNAATPTTFSVLVQDTTNPTLSLPANMTVEATGATGATVTYSASASDLVDASVSLSCLPASGSTFAIGTTTVNCSASDDSSNTATGSFTVTVQDKSAPTLNLPANITAEATSSAGAPVTFTVSASDTADGSLPVLCSAASGSTFAIGVTTVNCSATDAQSNTTNGSFTVTVQDTTGPTISSPVNITAEATNAAGVVVTYINPTTTDLVDGVDVATCSPLSGSTFALGNTTVTCNATDAHGNAATPTSFIVTVQDKTAPTLSLPANMTVEATGATGATVTYSASASDLVDASVSLSCLPASGSTFAMGTTTVNCSASDDSSNTATGSFTVTVQDKSTPTLNLPANITAEATSSAGAPVTFTVSASDTADGSLPVLCSAASGSVFALGVTTVNCSATDTQSNTTNGSFTVTVQDTTGPTISHPVNITFITNNKSKKDVVSYQIPVTSDAVDGAGFASCTPASGSVFSIGTTVVTCKAVDSHGNAATPVIFNINVKFIERSGHGTGGSGNSSLIPVTGGETIALDCNTEVMMLNIKVTFFNLCERQAILNNLDINTLPGKLPAGSTFIAGLNVTVLDKSQLLDVLPANAGIEMDFPISTAGQFAVLYWNNGQWVEVTQSLKEAELANALSKDASNELYKIVSSEKSKFKTLTTENTGTFILVKK